MQQQEIRQLKNRVHALEQNMEQKNNTCADLITNTTREQPLIPTAEYEVRSRLSCTEKKYAALKQQVVKLQQTVTECNNQIARLKKDNIASDSFDSNEIFYSCQDDNND